MRFWLPVMVLVLAFYEGIVRLAASGDGEARALNWPTARFVLLGLLIGGAAAYRIRRRDDIAVFALTALGAGAYYVWIVWPGGLSVPPTMLLGVTVGLLAGARGLLPVSLVILAGGAVETTERPWQDTAPVLEAALLVFLFSWVAGLTAMLRAARQWLRDEPALRLPEPA